MEDKKLEDKIIEDVNDENIDEKPVEIVEPVKIVEPADEIKEEKRMMTILYIIFALILVVIIGAIVFFLLTDMNRESENKNKNNNKHSQNVKDDISSNEIEIASWNGTYTNGSNTVVIYKNSKNTVIVNLVAGNKVAHIEPDVTSLTKIEYEEDLFGDESSIKIEKTNTGIKITSHSNEEDNILNLLSGVYTKMEFVPIRWDGTYSNDNGQVIISEINTDYITCTITFGYSSVMFKFSNVSEEELVYTDSSNNETLTITKTDQGIKVESSSSDEESAFNKISGVYQR